MKKSILVRLAALLLSIASLLTFAACSEDEESGVPDGMQNATATGADFRLYIPSSWSPNTAYGTSGGYYNSTNQSTVSVVKYVITDELEQELKSSINGDPTKPETRMDWFQAAKLMEPVRASATDGFRTLEAPISDVLGGAAARRYHYTATIQNVKLCFLQLVAERNGAFYVLTFSAVEDLYAMLYTDDRDEGDLGRMIKHFTFSDTPYKLQKPVKEIDNSTTPPTGMQSATPIGVAYRFYVPADWTVDLQESITSATSPDGLAVVSVTSYMPTATVSSVEGYFEQTEEMLELTAGSNYQLLSKTTGNLGGDTDAIVAEYLLTVGGVEYKYRQIIGNYRQMIYTLTYAAKVADFDANIEDMRAIEAAYSY